MMQQMLLCLISPLKPIDFLPFSTPAVLKVWYWLMSYGYSIGCVALFDFDWSVFSVFSTTIIMIEKNLVAWSRLGYYIRLLSHVLPLGKPPSLQLKYCHHNVRPYVLVTLQNQSHSAKQLVKDHKIMEIRNLISHMGYPSTHNPHNSPL